MNWTTSVKSFAFAAALLAACASARAELIITGVFDGPLAGGEPKVVELYATTNIPDLSRYAAGAANNGGGTDGIELILSGSAPAGSYLYIIDDNNEMGAVGTKFATYFGFNPALKFDTNLGTSGGPAAVNGDDAIELFFDPAGTFTGGQTVVDTFGDLTHTGAGAWNYLDGWAYRKNGTGPDGATFNIGNWTFSGVDANDNKTTNIDPNRFPIGTYAVPEPTSVLIGMLGAAALACVRRRTTR
jgi:hypothetical protein